jgi:hypothetical protein
MSFSCGGTGVYLFHSAPSHLLSDLQANLSWLLVSCSGDLQEQRVGEDQGKTQREDGDSPHGTTGEDSRRWIHLLVMHLCRVDNIITPLLIVISYDRGLSTRTV